MGNVNGTVFGYGWAKGSNEHQNSLRFYQILTSISACAWSFFFFKLKIDCDWEQSLKQLQFPLYLQVLTQ